jgi:hypothetical protein
MRRITQSTWECTQCGELVWIERGKRPFAIFLTVSDRSTERMILVERQVVHRCGDPRRGRPESLP